MRLKVCELCTESTFTKTLLCILLQEWATTLHRPRAEVRFRAEICILNQNTNGFFFTQPAGKMKLEFLENPRSRISNLFQAHFWDFVEIACWYWSDLARIQATKLGLGRSSLNFKYKCVFQAFPTLWKSELNIKSMELNPRKSKRPIPASYFKKNPRRA